MTYVLVLFIGTPNSALGPRAAAVPPWHHSYYHFSTGHFRCDFLADGDNAAIRGETKR